MSFPLKLDHVNTLTDDTGMLQHAIFTIPNRAEGYTTDDNARALIFEVRLQQLGQEHAGKNRGSQPGFSSPLYGVPRARFQSAEEKIPKFSRATIIAGWRSRDRKILTGALCGLSVQFWAGPPITG